MHVDKYTYVDVDVQVHFVVDKDVGLNVDTLVSV